MAVMPEAELAAAVTKYMQENQYASRSKLREKFGTSTERLERMAARGLIPPMPRPLDLRSAAKIAARVSPWRNNLKLKGTPDTGGKKTKPVRVK